MSNKNYEEWKIVKELNQKHDLNVNESHKEILELSSGKGDVGIKSRGKIDFLKNFRGYRKIWVSKF